jgi:hypothetical protein
LSSTKRQQVVNLTSFDDLWYSDFRLGVEKRSLPWLAVCDCCLIFRKLWQCSVRWNMNFSQVQKLMIVSNQVYINYLYTRIFGWGLKNGHFLD